MYYIKLGLSVLWTLVLFSVVYCLLRTMTGVSKHEFDGNGTAVYLSIAGMYILITIGLGLFLSKNCFYFLYALVVGTIAAPFVLIFILNHFPVH